MQKGSYYDDVNDFRRFVTLDYNLESYIGILGNGILDGWTVEQHYGTRIRILPGRGFIDGFFAESPYTVKLRSEMTGYDIEVDILTDDGVPEADPANDSVKTVVPTYISLPNNADLYIYAERPSGALPYPQLLDYPTRTAPLPSRADYSDHATYQVALDVWTAQIDTIHDYKWWDSGDNHFTEVEFGYSTSPVLPSNRVLLARVSTRSGTVSSIDVSNVQDLGNFRGPIERAAKSLIAGHQHGGTGLYDPPRIRLETDVRDTALSGFNTESGVASFKILDKLETTIEQAHKHKYVIDTSGDGITYKIIGTAESHYHHIESSEVLNQQGGSIIKDHIHGLSNASSTNLTSDSEYIVYVDDVVYGDETSSNISLSSDNSNLLITGISLPLRLFSTEFEVSGQSYSYQLRSWSVYHFMISMINDFNAEFYGVIEDIEDNPFLFLTEDGEGLVGLIPLEEQSQAAEYLLKEDGDTFLFTSEAAKNITITLEKAQVVPEVKIEVLGDVEVQGILSSDNIAYIHAKKILLGQFDVEVIPFVSHIGRLNEEFAPTHNALISHDGFSYSVSPSITGVVSGHYHDLQLDVDGDGFTVNTIVDSEPVLYADGLEGDTYFIGHRHAISDNVVANVSSEGVTSWQDDINSTTSATNAESHSHPVAVPIIGDRKIVYSIREDEDNHIYVGTSDGFMIVPNSSWETYSFVVNGHQYYFTGDDLWTLLLESKAQYERDTGVELPFTSNVYSTQVATASNSISVTGDSYLLLGEENPTTDQDEIMIQKVSSFRIPNFSYTTTKNKNYVVDGEIVLGDGEEYNTVIVTRDFGNVSAWSITMQEFTETDTSNEPIDGAYDVVTAREDVYVVGADAVLRNNDLINDFHKNWMLIDLPYSTGAATKVFKDSSNNKWLASESGLFVLRDHQLDGKFDSVYLPVVTPAVYDIVEGNVDTVYIATASGILNTKDEGKTWTTLLEHDDGFKQIIRDYANDRTDNASGHYHNLLVNIYGNGTLDTSVGAGTPHVHTVNSYSVATTLSHTHTYVVRLYAIASDKTIYRSLDSGTTWNEYGVLPDGECGDVFVAFNTLFVPQSDGTYRSTDGNQWTKILTKKAYSYNWNYDMDAFFVGGDNIIYESSNGASFGTRHEFDGSITPVLIENGVRKNFGYAYNNKSRSFYMKERFIPSDDNVLTALVDLDIWNATNGHWDSDSSYDIYVDYRLVLSTKTDVDRRDDNDYYFEVNPQNGLLDFRVSTITEEAVSIYDNTVVVDDVTGFLENDKVLIQSGDTRLYRDIEAITGNTFSLATRSDVYLPTSAHVYKLSQIGADLSVVGNIYESVLGSIGEFTHEELEDKLSEYSDGRPYKLNDAYLGSLMQLTQALMANSVYESIDSGFINHMVYDFVYSISGSPNPDIDDFIDVQLSDVFSQAIYKSGFAGKESRGINKVALKDGNVYVATDIGLFWASYDNYLEGTWFYIHELQQPVYDILFSTNNKALVATADGVYASSNSVSWALETGAAVNFPTYSFSLRWKDDDVVEVDSHDANFVKDATNNTSTITARDSAPYGDLIEHRGLKITIDGGDKDGNYTILSINNTSEITVSPAFSGSNERKNGVIMIMGTWWQQFDGDTNTSNANIENTIIAGGQDRIAFNFNDESFVWRESAISGTFGSNYIVQDFEPLSSGRMLGFASGIDSSDTGYILSTTGIGSSWSAYYTFEKVEGLISNYYITKFNHTMLEVSFTLPNEYVYMDGILAQGNITIYANGSSNSIFSGEIVDNQNIDGINQVVIFGSTLYDLFSANTSYSFVIDPVKVKTGAEDSTGKVFFGTDQGLYSDNNTIINDFVTEGGVTKVGVNGSITNVDIQGRVRRTSVNTLTGNSVLDIYSSFDVRGDTLVGKHLYVTDTNPVESYDIVANTSIDLVNECKVEIEGNISSSSYVNRRVTMVGDKSELYVQFDEPVDDNEFAGGSIYISSNENDNYGKSYDINTNTSDKIELSSAVVPPSTVALTDTDNDDVISGQNFRLVDSTNRLRIWSTFNRSIKENELIDMTMVLTTPDAASFSLPLTIAENAENNVLIDLTGNSVVTVDEEDAIPMALAFSPSDTFDVSGVMFNDVPSFNNKKTTTDQDHYHDFDLVNGEVSGDIDYFGAYDASHVVLYVNNTSNFSLPVVQLQEDLFEDAKIIFVNAEGTNARFESQVVSHNASSVTVRTKDFAWWSFDTTDTYKISEGWHWFVDASRYGYTDNVTYDDFVVINRRVTDTLTRGANSISLETTSSINTGDSIRIIDDTLSSQLATVDQIVDGTILTIEDEFNRTFYKKRNPFIKVLRDTFSNTHTHQVRDGVIQTVLVSDYIPLGYEAEHSHRSIPYIENISSVISRNSEIVVGGSSNFVYNTVNSGNSWSETINLNDLLEGGTEVDGVSSIDLISTDLAIGATTGSVFIERRYAENGVVPITPPTVS